ncbi:MAG: metallophosphatase family protein [Lachnospiraceae bacterium]|nr:metallophosphatase family protein [Lachnospiraceae bacterium]
MKILIMSDIHGNKEALKAVIYKAAQTKDIKACILLGDMIDYGMHSNEVIQMVKSLPYTVLCNICGNHENAVLWDEYGRFSSERGRVSAQYTRSILSQESWDYIHNEMDECGCCEFECGGKKCLAIHGSLENYYWKSIKLEDTLLGYEKYDYVFSGHSHIPHCFEKYYEVNNPVYRNRKKTIFINPGSVGQPRNHNPMAQYAVLDVEIEEMQLCKVQYNIASEQKSFTNKVDTFYKDRLSIGI